MKSYLIIAGLVLTIASPALAGDDPSIKGKQRESIKKAMSDHIEGVSIDEHYTVYDVVNGELKKLKLKELHEGIVKKGDYFVSCADFVDPQGTLYDIDFLVGAKDDSYLVVLNVIHAVDGKKRKYHVEDEGAQ